LLTVTMNPERPATMEDVGSTPHLTLRYIPAPRRADPLQDLPPIKMIGGIYRTFDWTLPQGRVVHDYLAEAGIERSPAALSA
jgi:hypothetical protein